MWRNGGGRPDGRPRFRTYTYPLDGEIARCGAMRFVVTLLLSLALTGAASGQQPQPGAVETMKPGEFLWAPEIAPEGPVTLVISLTAQRAFAYRNGVPVAVSTISSGKKGYSTPTGIFTILQKDADHRSNRYDDAPMPFMQRLTWDGVALHGGHLPGYPASHGCVRLPLEFARRLFAMTRTGVTVIITNDATAPEVIPSGPPLVGSPDGHAAGGSYVWRPERAPTGPVSIVVSGRDRRVVVLRNGVEIGSTSVVLDVPVTSTTAFTLAALDTAGTHWIRLPLPGQSTQAGELSPAERALGHVPEEFRQALFSILRPGATLLVTRDTLASSGTGTRLRVLEAR